MSKTGADGGSYRVAAGLVLGFQRSQLCSKIARLSLRRGGSHTSTASFAQGEHQQLLVGLNRIRKD
jgi:hypothetical protein